nr:collagen alpha-3(VI) chain-like [Biomphalaria glabrata]
MTTRAITLLLATLAAAVPGIFSQTKCLGNLDIIFAVDGSNSMGEDNFNLQKTSLVNLVNKLAVSRDEIHVGVIPFSSSVAANQVIQLTGNKTSLLETLNKLEYPDEQTRTDLAIDEAVAMFRRYSRGGSVPKLLMIITDGASTSPSKTVTSSNIAKADNITIYALGVTKQVDVAELQNLASKPDKVLLTPDFRTLEESLLNATNKACVDLKCVDSHIDLVFVLDTSSRVDLETFREMINFVKDFLAFAFVDNGNFRVGVMTYSDSANVLFQMTTFDRSKQSMMDALSALQYTPRAGSNLAGAMTLLKEMFTTRNGDRIEAPNVVILLSATYSNINQGSTIREAESVRSQSIQIFTVGIGINTAIELDGVASKPLVNNSFALSSFYQLRPVIERVYNSFNKFCESPPPVPGCYMGYSDLWLVLDVSSVSEGMARTDYTGDFAKLKNGVGKMMEIILDPSVQNTDIHTGLVTFSDYARTLVDISTPNSAIQAQNYVNTLPNGIQQSGASLVAALRLITTRARDQNYKSYVAIVAPETTYQNDLANIQNEFNRLKALGYTIVPFVVLNNRNLNLMNLQQQASGYNYLYSITGYNELEAATKNFTRDRLCYGYVAPTPSPSGGLCDNSGHRQNGMDVVPHPSDCDKYIQCYYNNITLLDIGVVRNCPMGLHWNQPSKTCLNTTQVRCTKDRCREDCEPFKMEGACGAYWDCENGVSVPKCCPPSFAFVSGVGCQLDFRCKDMCQAEKWCGLCQKKPNWLVASGYDVQLANGVLGWLPRPCFYEDFDVVDCDCSAPRNQVCPADREYFFNDTMTAMSVMDNSRDGIRVSSVSNNGMALALNAKSVIHVDMNRMDYPGSYVIEFVYKENGALSPYGETLFSSGVSCNHVNSLLVSATDQFVFAELRSSEGRQAEVKVPTTGLSVNEFKLLTLEYNDGVLSLSVKGSKQQYIAQTSAPALACLSCGIDIGAGVIKNSFRGEVQKLAIRSCSLPKLY